MNAMLTINVRVVGRAAQAQLNQLQQGVNGVVNAGSGSAAKKSMGFFSALRSNALLNAGKNLQWVGRQLTFNFTLPLAIAGAAMSKFNLDVERGLTRVKKVYGDLSFTQQRVNEETTALAHSFELLSTAFGVNQVEVVEIAEAWAAAGSAGRGLAENVQGTLEAMILGELDAASATEDLIAIQATWRLSTKRNAEGISELSDALAVLNVVENQTGIDFEGLLDALARSGGIGRQAGATIREMAAMLAALVPATGSAVQAGNALKTIFSRLVSPTKETIEVLQQMGVVMDQTWRDSTITQKILTMADAFSQLDQAQKAEVSSIIASRWQVNKFSVLMDDIASKTGYFAKAMDATTDQVRNNAVYQKELLTVLDSQPKKWDIMTNAIRNTMADALVQLIPTIMQVLGVFVQLTQWFASLPQETRTIILMGLAFLAMLGPLTQLIAVTMQLFGLIKLGAGAFAIVINRLVVPALAVLVKGIAAAVVGMAALGWQFYAVIGIVAAVAAAVYLIYRNWDSISEFFSNIFQSIADGISKLPGIFANALSALFRVVAGWVKAIWKALSYLNPFQRHSPSLVDNVKAGVATILNEYARLNYIPAVIGRAIRALDDFNTKNAELLQGFRDSELGVMRNRAVDLGADPASTDALVAGIKELEATLPDITAQIVAQTAVVAAWQAQYDAATQTLQQAEAALEQSESALESITALMDAARDRIEYLADVPLTGMRALEDQIFANEQAQNALNLELLEYERAGYTLDSIREKYAALNGEVEMLRGEQKGLRLAGAGSDVLGVYDEQIAAIEAQREELQGTEADIRSIQQQLDDLDLENRFLNLTKSINFDPLLRQIEQMVEGVDEMDFDDVVAGIQEQQALLAQLQPQYDAIVATIEQQQTAVDAAKKAQEEVGAVLDTEKDKLDALKQAYSDIEALIRDMEQAMGDFADQAEAAKRAAEGAGGGGGLGSGDFPVAGGDSTLGPEGLLADIEAFNAELEQKLKDIFSKMGLKIKEAISKMWAAVSKWFIETWNRTVGSWIASLWEGIQNIGTSIARFFFGIQTWITDSLEALWAWILSPLGWGLFGEGLGNVMAGAWKNVTEAVEAALEHIRLLFDFWTALLRGDWGAAWDAVFAIVKNVWDLIIGVVQGSLQMLLGYIQGFLAIVGKAFQMAWTAVYGYVVEPLKNAMLWITGVFSGITTTLSGIWTSVKLSAKEAWETVKNYIISPIQSAIDWIGGVPAMLKGFFNSIYDTAFGWAKQIVLGIRDGIANVGDTIIAPIRGAVRFVVDKLNWLIDKWNSLGLHVGGGSFLGVPIPRLDLEVPQIPKIGYPFHGGGVVPDVPGREAWALVQSGEVIFQPDQLSALAKAGFGRGFGDPDGGGSTTIVINGNLSFPGITDGDDAEEFIENLKAMVP